MSGWPQLVGGAARVYEVLSPSGDTTGATDYTNIQNALTNAIPTAGTVLLMPGTYYINQSIVVGPPTTAVGVPQAAPSLIAFNAAGHIGDVLFPTEVSGAEIVCAAGFPNGKYCLDYQENANGQQWTGGWIKGLSFSCQLLGAGVRFQGIRQFTIEDLSINDSQLTTGYEGRDLC